MKPPFPYYGGKSRQAKEVWSRLGDPTVYVEPFAGSLAVLLARDAPGQREIVCDLNGYISNFWRALREDPEAVAYWADYPTFHHDLTDRHRWLIAWGRENREQIRDADWYDVKAAGWWVWGISSWIGGGWCEDKGDVGDQIPRVSSKNGGRGVQAQKITIPKVNDKRPLATAGQSGGHGVQAQRHTIPKVSGQMPKVVNGVTGSGVQVQKRTIPKVNDQRPVQTERIGGHGVQAQRQQLSPAGVDIGTGERLSDWFHALAQRLSRVAVLNRCLLYTSPSPRDRQKSRMPSSA